ncbi:hypothetical protein [Streptomyces griseiscabiei]|uniref:Uncharacterized protein n=1 Tax=Streptomyces griseiscabiei TaxID=2993540 RepID=A0ABU4LL74_9ACTN|nr:hypothetical protein [Streptomyces griseiscabiei]MDX2916383.1 hypothetical protein [Streptomyces griseiscabiei]
MIGAGVVFQGAADAPASGPKHTDAVTAMRAATGPLPEPDTNTWSDTP